MKTKFIKGMGTKVEGRWGASLVPLTNEYFGVMVGGRDENRVFDDAYVIDGDYGFTRLELPGFEGRFGHASVLRPTSGSWVNEVYVFGGLKSLDVAGVLDSGEAQEEVRFPPHSGYFRSYGVVGYHM